MNNEEIQARIVEKLVRKNVIGARHVQIETVVAWFPSDQRSTVKDAINTLLRRPDSPIESHGSRDTIRLSGLEKARQFLSDSDSEVPWHLREPNERETEEADSEKKDFSESQASTDSTNSDSEELVKKLEKEIDRLEQASEDWREEARRRQRANLIIGGFSFVIGLVTSGIFQIIF